MTLSNALKQHDPEVELQKAEAKRKTIKIKKIINELVK